MSLIVDDVSAINLLSKERDLTEEKECLAKIDYTKNSGGKAYLSE